MDLAPNAPNLAAISPLSRTEDTKLYYLCLGARDTTSPKNWPLFWKSFKTQPCAK